MDNRRPRKRRSKRSSILKPREPLVEWDGESPRGTEERIDMKKKRVSFSGFKNVRTFSETPTHNTSSDDKQLQFSSEEDSLSAENKRVILNRTISEEQEMDITMAAPLDTSRLTDEDADVSMLLQRKLQNATTMNAMKNDLLLYKEISKKLPVNEKSSAISYLESFKKIPDSSTNEGPQTSLCSEMKLKNNTPKGSHATMVESLQNNKVDITEEPKDNSYLQNDTLHTTCTSTDMDITLFNKENEYGPNDTGNEPTENISTLTGLQETEKPQDSFYSCPEKESVDKMLPVNSVTKENERSDMPPPPSDFTKEQSAHTIASFRSNLNSTYVKTDFNNSRNSLSEDISGRFLPKSDSTYEKSPMGVMETDVSMFTSNERKRKKERRGTYTIPGGSSVVNVSNHTTFNWLDETDTENLQNNLNHYAGCSFSASNSSILHRSLMGNDYKLLSDEESSISLVTSKKAVSNSAVSISQSTSFSLPVANKESSIVLPVCNKESTCSPVTSVTTFQNVSGDFPTNIQMDATLLSSKIPLIQNSNVDTTPTPGKKFAPRFQKSSTPYTHKEPEESRFSNNPPQCSAESTQQKDIIRKLLEALEGKQSLADAVSAEKTVIALKSLISNLQTTDPHVEFNGVMSSPPVSPLLFDCTSNPFVQSACKTSLAKEFEKVSVEDHIGKIAESSLNTSILPTQEAIILAEPKMHSLLKLKSDLEEQSSGDWYITKICEGVMVISMHSYEVHQIAIYSSDEDVTGVKYIRKKYQDVRISDNRFFITIMERVMDRETKDLKKICNIPRVMNKLVEEVLPPWFNMAFEMKEVFQTFLGYVTLEEYGIAMKMMMSGKIRSIFYLHVSFNPADERPRLVYTLVHKRMHLMLDYLRNVLVESTKRTSSILEIFKAMREYTIAVTNNKVTVPVKLERIFLPVTCMVEL